MYAIDNHTGQLIDLEERRARRARTKRERQQERRDARRLKRAARNMEVRELDLEEIELSGGLLD